MKIHQLNKEQAIAVAKSGIWKKWSDKDVVRFQLFQNLLCMDFSRFQEAIEKVLDRPVFTHEFAFRSRLVDEYLNERDRPTFQEVIDLIPKEKRVFVITGEEVEEDAETKT